jgi:hypothetical protein
MRLQYVSLYEKRFVNVERLIKVDVELFDVKDGVLLNLHNLINECGKEKSHLQI